MHYVSPNCWSTLDFIEKKLVASIEQAPVSYSCIKWDNCWSADFGINFGVRQAGTVLALARWGQWGAKIPAEGPGGHNMQLN